MCNDKIDFLKLQIDDFKKIVDLFEQLIFSYPIDIWEKAVKKMDNILGSNLCSNNNNLKYIELLLL